MSASTASPAATAPARAPKVETPWRRFVSEFCESKLALAGLIVFAIIVFIAIFAE